VKLISIWLSEFYIECLDELVRLRYYPNRNEAIRIAIRGLLWEHEELFRNKLRKKLPLKLGGKRNGD